MKSFKLKLVLYFGATILAVALILGVVLTISSSMKLDEMRSSTSETLINQTSETISSYLNVYTEAINMLSVDSNVLSTPSYNPSIPWLLNTFKNFINSYEGADYIYIGYSDPKLFTGDLTSLVKEFYTAKELENDVEVIQDPEDTKTYTLTEQAILNAERGLFAYPHFYGKNYYPVERDWYKQGMASDEVVWSPSYIDDFTKLPVVSIIKQIKDENNQSIGVIAADISLSTISDTYSQYKIGNTGTMFILDQEGNVISHADSSQLGQSVVDLGFWPKMTAKDSGYVSYEYDGATKELYFQTEPLTGWKIAVSFKDNELAKDINPLIIMNIIFIILSVMAGAAVAYLISGKITKDINTINGILTKVADGDLTEKVTMNRADEIGQMAQNLNLTIDTLNEIVNEINTTSVEVKSNADNLTQAISESTLATEEIAQSIQDVAKGSNTQAVEVQDGSSKMKNVNIKINNVNDLSTEMGKLSDEVKDDSQLGIVTMKKLMTKAEEKEISSKQLSTIITSVDDQSRKISEITSTISSIAEQTNLLALNASIESARAGEAGRGFAVVADEIRKLAEQSSLASKDIKNLIDHMLNQSSEAVKTVEKNRVIDSEEFDAIKITEETFNRIFEQLGTLLINISEIKIQNNDVNNDANALLDVMTNISSITEETSAASQQVSASTEEQLASMEEISSQTEHLRETIENLHHLISKFKTL